MLCSSNAPTATYSIEGEGGRPVVRQGKASSRLAVAFSSSDDEAKPKGFFPRPGLKSCRAPVPFSLLRGRPLWCLLMVQEPKACCGSSLQSVRSQDCQTTRLGAGRPLREALPLMLKHLVSAWRWLKAHPTLAFFSYHLT